MACSLNSLFYLESCILHCIRYTQERERAETLNYPDPINQNFEATSLMYHKCLAECMHRIQDLKQQGERVGNIRSMLYFLILFNYLG